MPANLQFLEQTPIFHGMGPEQLNRLAGLLKYTHFNAGASICYVGQPGETMYFIEKGDIDFSTQDVGGTEKVFRSLKAGDFFGEIAVLNRGVRSANARARTEVFAWELHRDHFPAFVATCPDMAVTMMKEMARRLETSGEMLRDTVTPSIAHKIDANRTPGEKRVEALVRILGGTTALVVNGVGCLLWILLNRMLPRPWDSVGYGYLGLFLAFEALIVTILVLAKQNRDEKDANIRNDTIVEKVQTTPLEIKHLREQVKALAELIHHERHDRMQPPK